MLDENAITTDEHAAIKDPLKTFDLAINLSKADGITPGDQKHYKKLILRCILFLGGRKDVAESVEDENVENCAKDALDKFQEMQNKEIIAACYMRLMAEPEMAWVTLPPWRPKVVEFLDEVLGSETYKEWKINKDFMAHEKVPLLTEVVTKQEKTLIAAFESLTSLNQLLSHRQNLMEALRNKTGRIIMRPFLPIPTEALLKELYKKIEIYIEQRESLGGIDAYHEAKESIKRFSEQMTGNGTYYSKLIGLELETRFTTILDDDFANNKAAQPATVCIEARAKKYPLHLVGNTVNLGFIVRNTGPGYAYETKVIVLVDENVLDSTTSEIDIGRLPPNESQLIKIPAEVLIAQESISVLAQVTWRNYTGDEFTNDTQEVIKGQRVDIDWLALQQQDPYSLEPVASQKELVGRKEVLNRLLASLKAVNIGSSIIHGQKRVGKTSIAKVLHSHLKEYGYLVIYLEAGDYVMPSAVGTINGLGSKISKKIIEAEVRTSFLQVPVFDQALSPLTDFLDSVNKIIPDTRIVIILDEFDELPLELYTRGPWGDSFFLTLRSITSRSNIGFILVGGEKMAHILDSQGDQLNKWSLTPVDYFTRETDWADYKELVQRPVQDVLEYTEESLAFLYELTAGNPYFTKLICQYIFRQSLMARDCYITRFEVEQAVEQAIRETGKNTFQHFWEDGIFETGEKATEKSIRRRRILIALSDLLQRQSPVSGKDAAIHPLVKDIPTLENDLKEFVTRKVLVGQIVGQLTEHNYSFKVPFFHLWLKGRGIQDVIATFADLDAALRERQVEEQLKVQSTEVVDLVNRWGIYKGQKITEDKVRAWLEQFPVIKEQRVMFNMLKGLHYYSNEYVRSKMEEVQGIVTRGIGRSMGYRQQKRGDILVSYIDGPSKSGAHFARLFADEADIYVDNVVEKGKLVDEIKKREDIKAVVFLDDFVGTGNQASENLQSICKALAGVVSEKEIRFFFITAIGMKRGIGNLKNVASTLTPSIEVHCCEMLDDADQYFSEKSDIFNNSNIKDEAREIALRYGKLLVKDNPLGYGDLGIGVVFEHSCPNDSLPIIWAESPNPRWTALFKRH